MLAATAYDLVKELHGSKVAAAAGDAAAHVTMTSERWMVLGVGFVVSFIVALGVVEWFLMWVRKHGFTVFAVYRIIVGVLLLVWGARLIGS
jgi:undecaprenyl-diphosphatase